MEINKNNLFKIIVIGLIFISFFLGYFLRENASGGGLEFYNLSWPIIQSLKKDFMFTINNYGTYGDATIPFSHILNAYLNPFTNLDTNFQLSVTIISFFIFLTFAYVLKKVFSEINPLDILLTASVFLILPFFRASAFWGKNENYGWFFLILAFYFFFEIKKIIYKNPQGSDILKVAFFCLTSACALYSRQALIFLPLSYLLFLVLNNSGKKIIFSSLFFFSILAIPGLLLFWIWGGIYDVNNIKGQQFFGDWFSYGYILRNIPIILSFFGFYLLPILIIELFNFGIKNFINKYYKSFIIVFAFLIFLSFLGVLDYLGNYEISGGAVLKLNYIIQKNNFLLLLVFSSIGFSILVRFLKEDFKNNIAVLLPVIVIYGFPASLYQEYVEPLILIIFFLGIKTELHKLFFKNITISNIIFLSYFSLYLIAAIYFKHFAFISYEEWKIFLN